MMDARIRYTKRMIRQVMIALLQEKNIEKITVKEICEKAEINRATFYKYYDNPYDLLHRIETELLNELEAKIQEKGTTEFHDIFRIVLDDIKENYEAYDTLFRYAGDAEFRRRLFDICYRTNMQTIENFFPNLPERYRAFLYYFIAEGSNGVLNRWLSDGRAEEGEQLVDFIDAIVQSINQGASIISDPLNK